LSLSWPSTNAQQRLNGHKRRVPPFLNEHFASGRAGEVSNAVTALQNYQLPSELIPYISDEQAAEWSAHDVKTVLAELASLGPDVPIYVIAHSMGNRVLARALKDLATQDRTQLAAFKEVALTAPDIDADVFKREIAPAVLGRGPRVTLYASSNDVALAASRKLHGGYRRLGESDPEVLVMKEMDTVDASNIKTDFMGHSYFGDSGTVMADLFYLIRQRLKPAERFALEPVRSTGGDYWRFKR
jgi:Uncharacterized protein conserved in bacteria